MTLRIVLSVLKVRAQLVTLTMNLGKDFCFAASLIIAVVEPVLPANVADVPLESIAWRSLLAIKKLAK